MDRHRALAAVGIEEQCPVRADGERLLLVGGVDAGAVRFDPDLEQAAGLIPFVDLAVHHPCAGAHALHLSGTQHLGVTHRIAVVQLPLHHHRDDLHVAVGMHAEAAAGGDAVVVDHPQRTETHPGRVDVRAE
jgi:hypothetical protein